MFLVPEAQLKLNNDHIFSAFSFKPEGENLKIFVGCQSLREPHRASVVAKVVAEAVVHEYHESVSGMSHRDVSLLEFLLCQNEELLPRYVSFISLSFFFYAYYFSFTFCFF